MLWIDNAAFSSNYCSYLLYIFLQLGKIKVTAKWGLKIVRIHIQNSAIIMTNGIRKVRQGVDIFDKRILDSCKFISDSTLRIWPSLPEYFIDFFYVKMDPMSGCDIRLVFTLPLRDRTLQYKKCVCASEISIFTLKFFEPDRLIEIHNSFFGNPGRCFMYNI